MAELKFCRPGDHFVPASDEFFYRNAKTGRLRSHCKSCRRREASGWYVRNHERGKAARRSYSQAHSERQAEYLREYYSQNREAMIQRSKRWATGNPGKARVNNANSTRAYQARKKGVAVEHVDRMAVWSRDGGICGICKKEADVNDFHVDHVIPLSAGGPHSYDNVQVAHSSCNTSKGARVLVGVQEGGEFHSV